MERPEFGELLAQWMGTMTQARLARELGVSRQTVRNWLNGVYRPSRAGVVDKVAASLRLSRSQTRQLSAAAGFTPGHGGPDMPVGQRWVAEVEVKETVRCPMCKSEVQFSLRSGLGESAMPICDKCKNTFYAHRTPRGLVVRPPHIRVVTTADLQDLEETTCRCPRCQAWVIVQIGRSRGNAAFPKCSQCKSLLHVNRIRDGSLEARLLGRPMPDRPSSEVDHECPYCRSAQTLSAQGVIGLVAHPVCSVCQRRYVVSRLRSGHLRIDELPSDQQRVTTRVRRCPNCGAPISGAAPLADLSRRWCFGCESRVRFDIVDELPVDTEPAVVLDGGVVEQSANGRRWLLQCLSHLQVARSLGRFQNRLYGYCEEGDHLIRAELDWQSN